MNSAVPSSCIGASGAGGAYRQTVPPGATACGGSGDRIGLGRAHDGDVDELVAVTLGSGCQRPGEAVRARLADPHGVDAAGVGGGDRQQAVDAGADHEQRVARAQARALLRAQHARQRFDQRCVDGVQAVREDEELGSPARARGGRARRSRRDPGASRGTARTSSRGRGGTGGTRRMACDGGWRPDRRRRRRRPPRRRTARHRSAHGRAPPAAWPPRTSPSRRRRRHRTRGPRRRPRRVPAQGHRAPRCGRRRHRTSGRPSSGHEGGERLGVNGLGDAALGHERCDECRRRHVERGVATRRVRAASVRSGRSAADLFGVALLDRDLRAGRALGVDRRGRPRDHERDLRRPEPPAPGRRCRLCSRRRRWRPPGRSRRSRRRARRRRSARRPAESTDELVRDPQLPELVHGQPGALEQRPRLGGDRPAEATAAPQLVDHRERRAPTRGRQCAGVAVRQDPPAAREELGAVGGDRLARSLLLGVDCPGLAERRFGSLIRRERSDRCPEAVDGVGEVDRGRPRRR